MGCFDEVQFACPACDNDVLVQTKAGDCAGVTFQSDEVPACIAQSLAGRAVTCSHCGSELQLDPETPIQTVRMQANKA